MSRMRTELSAIKCGFFRKRKGLQRQPECVGQADSALEKVLGEEEPHNCMEEAARDYLEEVRTVQPEGPYLLGGFSGGGITAYEMARQLEAAEEDIGALIMLDTPLPVRSALTRADKALIKWRELRQKGVAYLGEW